jgi:hypothetical protein
MSAGGAACPTAPLAYGEPPASLATLTCPGRPVTDRHGTGHLVPPSGGTLMHAYTPAAAQLAPCRPPAAARRMISPGSFELH